MDAPKQILASVFTKMEQIINLNFYCGFIHKFFKMKL